MQTAHRSIVVLTGAGISAESGLATFRDKDGLWEGHRVEDVACPEAFARDPARVQRFYNLRRAGLQTVEPNAAHLALARLQRDYPGEVTLLTQNVDDLHERAGSQGVIHMHGELLKVFCGRCGWKRGWQGDLTGSDPCPSCERTHTLRPDIVWFGEIPYRMDEIEDVLMRAEVFAAIGTSGHVYPAAGFVSLARFHGAATIEINAQGTQVSGQFDRHLVGPATVEVARWVEECLG
ncbi:MAG: NAD-dependent deacylase [Akkermansiaceae bacterium]|nr:NAD-dependent deacylase [Akkermansiaceae bacterium]MCF7730221.1 NAD-dependent deacylase [Akkermansiaceae bacterium]